MLKLKLSEFLDKLVLLLSMLVFAWVGLMAIKEARYLNSIAGQGRPLLSEMTLNAPKFEAEAPEAVEANWSTPPSQSRGEDWVFDSFTPPVIYYDPQSEVFAVTPPTMNASREDAGVWASFEVELVDVRPRPYRLQLVGYAGEPGNYMAYLENSETGALVVLGQGRTDSEAAVRLIDFRVNRDGVESEESMTVYQNIGVATIYDLRSQEEVQLTNAETKMFSDLEARVRILSSGEVRSVKTGSRLVLESGDYVIGDLSISPETASITKFSKDGARSLTKALTKSPHSTRSDRSSDDPSQSNSSPFSIRSGSD